MKFILAVWVLLLLIPLVAIGVEVYFCKKNKEKAALYFPLCVGGFGIFFGAYALVWMAILYGIYFIDRHFKIKRADETKRMNDMDLEDF